MVERSRGGPHELGEERRSIAPTIVLVALATVVDAALSAGLFTISHDPPLAQFLGLPFKLLLAAVVGFLVGRAGGRSPVLLLTSIQLAPAYGIAVALLTFVAGDHEFLLVGSALWVACACLGSAFGYFRRLRARAAT